MQNCKPDRDLDWISNWLPSRIPNNNATRIGEIGLFSNPKINAPK